MADQRYVVGINFQVDDLQSKLSAISSRVPQNMFAGSQAGADSLSSRFAGITSAARAMGASMRDAFTSVPQNMFAGSQAGADSLSSRFAGITSAARAMGASMRDAFTSAVERAGDIAMTLGKLGAAAGVGAAVYGVASLNSELEKTQIALADIFTANGVTGNLTDGMGMAADMMKQIRKDAAALPGETSDLAQIFKMAAIPGIQAGADPQKLEKLSANAMAFGMGVANLDGATVARELSMLISGRAGSHNVLGLQLAALGGDKAKEFNQMSAPQRLAVLTKEFEKHAGSIALFSNSFEGLSSTLKDNAKLFLSNATKPLFDHVKGTIASLNGWFDSNQGRIGTWANLIGQKLSDAWDTGVAAIERWWPAIRSFGLAAYQEIADIWRKVEPEVTRIGGAIRQSLGDGSALEKIESILKLYAAVKIGSAAGSAMGPMGSLGLSMMGRMGGGAAGLGAGGALGGGLLLGGALAAGGIAAGTGAALADPNSDSHAAAVANVSDFAIELNALTKTIDVSVMPYLEKYGTQGLASLNTFLSGIDNVSHPLEYANFALMNFSDRLGIAGDSVKTFLNWLNGPKLNPTEDPTISRDDYEIGPGTFVKRMGESIVEAQHKIAPKLGAGGGGGGMNVTNYFTISSNESPSRIARQVTQKFAETARFPTSSRHVPNWTAGRQNG